jgi:hypothetical protein
LVANLVTWKKMTGQPILTLCGGSLPEQRHFDLLLLPLTEVLVSVDNGIGRRLSTLNFLAQKPLSSRRWSSMLFIRLANID